MSTRPRASVQIVTPVHNEAGSIAETLREFHRVAGADGIDVAFIVCEDGSSDGTPDILARLASELPLSLDSVEQRRGYSRAVVDGLRAASADVVGFIDSDGQCDPADLVRLLDALEGADLAVGYRHPRRDPLARKLMSASFGVVFRRVFPVPHRDPSCPYLVARRDALAPLLDEDLGLLPQGFWWEFAARTTALGLVTRQVPVNHRARSSGRSQVYKPATVPRIVIDQFAGLARLRRTMVPARRSVTAS